MSKSLEEALAIGDSVAAERALHYASQVHERKVMLEIDRDARMQLAASSWNKPDLEMSDQLPDLPPEFLIGNHLEVGTVGMLVGAYGTGKSFLALDWAASVAAGHCWYENAVEAGSVLYVAAEGGPGMGRRVRAWEHAYGTLPPARLSFLRRPVPIAYPEGREYIKEISAKISASLIVVDTLARSIPGLNENDAIDMGRVIDACYELRDASPGGRAVILLVHHHGKDATRGARGSSRLTNDIDFCFEISKQETEGGGSFLRMEATKMKDSALPLAMDFRLSEVSWAPGLHSCVIDMLGGDHTAHLCRQCGEQFFDRDGVIYCSPKCRNKFNNDKRRETPLFEQGSGITRKRRQGR